MQIHVEIQKGHDSATLGRINASRFNCLQQGQLVKLLMLMLSDPPISTLRRSINIAHIEHKVCKVKR